MSRNLDDQVMGTRFCIVIAMSGMIALILLLLGIILKDLIMQTFRGSSGNNVSLVGDLKEAFPRTSKVIGNVKRRDKDPVVIN